ncbi:hypothetical protein TYRP_021268 [Tyrophagus putrescentiae]|nr:hypothetical protein TYRP_021268 [Tyrophagus putrescentiae]
MNTTTLCLVIAFAFTTIISGSSSLAASISGDSHNSSGGNFTITPFKSCPKMLDHLQMCLVKLHIPVSEAATRLNQLLAVMCCPSSPLRDCLVPELFADPGCNLGGITSAQLKDFHNSPDCKSMTTTDEVCGRKHQL